MGEMRAASVTFRIASVDTARFFGKLIGGYGVPILHATTRRVHRRSAVQQEPARQEVRGH